VSLKAELNGTRHNTKPTHNTEPTPEYEKLTTPRRRSTRSRRCRDAGVREADDAEERRSATGLRRRAGSAKVDVRVGPRSTQHNERLTPRSGEVQEAYAEERGSAGS
jgi:hypothetical protein